MPLSGVMAIAQSEYPAMPSFFVLLLYVSLNLIILASRSEHVAGADGTRHQQRHGQSGSPAAGAVLAAVEQPTSTAHATVVQPHESAALHGICLTLTQSVLLIC